jgi:hypothetical protein
MGLEYRQNIFRLQKKIKTNTAQSGGIMKAAEIKRNIKRMKLGTIDRYEGEYGVVDVHKSTGGMVTITLLNHTLDAVTDMLAAINPDTVCASPEDPNR